MIDNAEATHQLATEPLVDRAADCAAQIAAVGKAQAVIEFNLDGTIITANDNFLAAMGYSLQEIQGRHHSMFVEDEYRVSSEYKEFWARLNRGEFQAAEYKRIGKGGKEVFIRATYNPIFDPNGKPFKVVKFATDVTVENAKRAALAAERARAEEFLRVARDAAEAASRAKSEFLANMSHEIRTPMTAILGFADILAASLDRPEQQDAIQTIKRNSDHLLGLINDILDLSKIEAGKLDIEPLPTSPKAIVEDVASMMRVRADAKGLPLKLEYRGPIPQTIQVDPTRLRQILVNLVGNAIKFTETGEVKIAAQLPNRDTGKPTFQYEVMDTGMGMSREQLDRLFQPFHQADNSVTRKFGGTGLGLAISKRLARMLGGDITVSSVLGEGSTFTLTVATGPLDGIDFVDQPSEAVAAQSKANTPAMPSQVRLACRILLAEDGPDNQRLISFVLKMAGAEVVICENGQKAMEKALATLPGFGRRFDDSKEPFDVILMDMQMPVMDGYEATRRLREKGYTGPILALTAHAMKEDRQKCLDAGCDAYLTKPIERELFVNTIAGYLKLASAENIKTPQILEIP